MAAAEAVTHRLRQEQHQEEVEEQVHLDWERERRVVNGQEGA